MTYEKDGSTVYPIILPVEGNLKTINFFVVKNGDRLTLIDAGANRIELWNLFLQTLHDYGFSINDLTEIVLTHFHSDHVGLVNRIIAEHPIPVYAHQNSIPRLQPDEKYLPMREKFFAGMYKEMDCREKGEKQVRVLREVMHKEHFIFLNPSIDIIPLREGDLLFNQFKVIEIFGHSPDHIALYDEKRKWFFGGDQVIKHMTTSAIIENDFEGNRIPALVQYVESMNRCKDIEMDIIFTGHGEMIDQSPREVIRERLERIEVKQEKILNLIKKGFNTGDQISEEMYQKRYHMMFNLIISEIVSHLDLLEHRNLVGKKYKDGVCYYFAL